jgi:hypothetical protein
MKVYKGKNIIAIISSVFFGVAGAFVLGFSTGSVMNIIGIALFISCILGISNYIKYSIIIDTDELRITGVFKIKKIKYKDIVKIFTVQAGKVSVSYIVDKYCKDGKWYIRGTYPPQMSERIDENSINSLNEVVSINSYNFSGYRDILKGISKKVGISCDINSNAWAIINS